MDAPAVNVLTHRQADDRSALGHLPSHLIFWPVAMAVLGLDLWSKSAVFSHIEPDKTVSIVPGILDFRRSLNDGAVFGSFTGYVGVFVFASLIALGFVFYLFAHSRRRHHGLHIALGLVLAGALGNLYDRAFIVADVVDVRVNGETERIIGKVLPETDGKYVKIGAWPEGAKPRTFTPDVVTIRHQGVVRDFLKFSFRFPSWSPMFAGYDVWPWIFNVADAALVCGVGILLLHTWFDRREPVSPTTAAE